MNNIQNPDLPNPRFDEVNAEFFSLLSNHFQTEGPTIGPLYSNHAKKIFRLESQFIDNQINDFMSNGLFDRERILEATSIFTDNTREQLKKRGEWPDTVQENGMTLYGDNSLRGLFEARLQHQLGIQSDDDYRAVIDFYSALNNAVYDKMRGQNRRVDVNKHLEQDDYNRIIFDVFKTGNKLDITLGDKNHIQIPNSPVADVEDLHREDLEALTEFITEQQNITMFGMTVRSILERMSESIVTREKGRIYKEQHPDYRDVVYENDIVNTRVRDILAEWFQKAISQLKTRSSFDQAKARFALHIRYNGTDPSQHDIRNASISVHFFNSELQRDDEIHYPMIRDGKPAGIGYDRDNKHIIWPDWVVDTVRLWVQEQEDLNIGQN